MQIAEKIAMYCKMKTILKRATVQLLLLSAAAFPLISAGESYFNSSEFRNFFLPQEFRETPSEQIPKQVIVDAEKKLEKALSSVFERLTVPLVLAGEEKPTSVRYLKYLTEELKKIDPNVKVRPSGGVVRSAIGYIYSEMLEGLNKNPSVSAETTLANIINEKSDLPGIKVRGVGSDFDVLLEHSGNKLWELKKRAAEITNSAETQFGMRNLKGGFKRSVFTVGDIKDYHEQTGRSTKQGGATIDFLAFDLERGIFIEPESHRGIVEQILRGQYQYIAPQTENNVEDKHKQTIRGIRALIELPFLRLQDSGQLEKELKELLKDVQEGKTISSKALEQFEKAVRNARFSGANNRLYRGAPNSLESLIQQVNLALEEKYNRATIPEFVDRFPLEGRKASAQLQHLLMPVETFVKNHTDNGVLYHGTPDIESGLAIMRGGLFISKVGGKIQKKNTVAAFGRGGYSSKNKTTALGYAGAEGLVFELEVQKDKPLQILDWLSVKDTPEIKAISSQALEQGRDVFEVLARDHGIDFIIHTHVLIQNTEALKFPKDIRKLVEAYHTIIENPHADPQARISAYNNYRQLHGYAIGLGETETRPPLTVEQLTELFINKSDAPFAAVKTLLSHSELNQEAARVLQGSETNRQRLRGLLNEALENEQTKIAASRIIIDHLDLHDKANILLARKVAQNIKELSKSGDKPILEVMMDTFQVRIDGKEELKGAPRDIVALEKWLRKKYWETKDNPHIRVLAYQAHEAIKSLAIAMTDGNPPIAHSKNQIMNELFMSKDIFSAFDAMMNSNIFFGDVKLLIESDKGVRNKFRQALNSGLQNKDEKTRKKAILFADHYLPVEEAQDQTIHRKVLVARLDNLEPETDDYKYKEILLNPEFLKKVLTSDDPAHTRFLPILEKELKKPHWTHADREIVKVILNNPETVYRKFPQLKKWVDRVVFNLSHKEGMYGSATAYSDEELSNLVRKNYPEHWKRELKNLLRYSSADDFKWDLNDSTHVEVIKETLRNSRLEIADPTFSDVLKEVKHRYPDKYKTYETDSGDNDTRVKNLFNNIPNLTLRKRGFKAWEEDGYHGSNDTVLRHLFEKNDDLFKNIILKDRTLVLPYGTYKRLAEFPENLPFIVEQLNQQGELQDRMALRIVLGSIEPLKEAVLSDPKWRTRARNSLNEKSPILYWQQFPWDFQSEEDAQFLITRFLENREIDKNEKLSEIREGIFVKILQDSDSLPSLQKVAIRDTIKEASPHFSESYKLKTNGENSLTVGELKDLESFLKVPIDNRQFALQYRNHLTEDLRSETVHRILNRLKELRPEDSVFHLLIAIGDKKDNWTLLKEDSVFWNKLLNRMKNELVKGADIYGLEYFPWDVKDPEHQTILEKAYQELNLTMTHLTQDKKRFERYEGYIANGNTEYIENYEDRIWANKNHKLYKFREQLDKQLKNWSWSDPIGFYERFGKAHYFGTGNELGSYGPWIFHPSVTVLNEILKKMSTSQPLSDADKAVLHLYLDHFQDYSFLEKFLMQEGDARNFAISKLKERNDHAAKATLALIDKERWGSEPARHSKFLIETLKTDKGWWKFLVNWLDKNRPKQGLEPSFLPWDINVAKEHELRSYYKVKSEKKEPWEEAVYKIRHGEKIQHEEIELFKRFLEQPLHTYYQRYTLQKALEDTRLIPLIQKRLQQRSSSDDFRSILRTLSDIKEGAPSAYKKLRSNTEFWSKIQKDLSHELDNDKTLYRKMMRQRTESYGSAIDLYPWDFSDKKDIETFKKWYQEDQAKKGRISETQKINRQSIQVVLDDLAYQNFQMFRRHFPEAKLQGVGFDSFGANSYYTETVLDQKYFFRVMANDNLTKLMTKIKNKENLSQNEKAIKNYLEANDHNFKMWLFSLDGPDRLRILSELKKAHPKEILKILSGEIPHFSFHIGVLADALRKDLEWRRKLFAYVEDPSVRGSAWKNLFDAFYAVEYEDKLARSKLANRVKADPKDALIEFRLKLTKKHKIPFNFGEEPDSLPSKEIPTGLRKEYQSLVDIYHLSQTKDVKKYQEINDCLKILRELSRPKYWPLPN
jgi:hypothetical protein